MTIVGKAFSSTYDADRLRQMRAFNGQILRVDLTDGEIWVDAHDEDFYRTYLGGRGIVLYYLLSEMPTRTDPLGPENQLVFAPGVLTDTIPGSGRHGVGAKSPLTGALGSGEAGGWWGSELKRAGFDAVVIQGRAEHPVYLWIEDGQVEIHDARHLWGRDGGEVEDTIREELGDNRIRVTQIGPAGENLVRYACIINDANRAAGRCGLGAVMGSKNLKAVAVRGTARLGLANREPVDRITKWISKNYRTLMDWAVVGGTAGVTKDLHDIGATPVRNWTKAVFNNIEQVDGKQYFDLMLAGRNTCNRCPVRCKIVVEYEDDDYTIDSKYGGPEYETIGAFGPLCEVDDPVAVAKANELCEAYGLDTISAGGTIAFVMECAERGLLRPSDDGFLPRFGDGEALVEAIHRIANRRGIGDLMAEGSARMAQSLGKGAEAMVVTTRMQEVPMHDPRLKNAFGLGYALSATGADHEHNMDDTYVTDPTSSSCARLEELGIQTPLPLFGLPEEKIQAFVYETAYKNFTDSALLCNFYPYEWRHLGDALKGATGWDMDHDEIVEFGRRVLTMARVFLIREGSGSDEDRLPERLYEPHNTGPVAGKAPTPEMLHKALRTYYRLMGWDETGIPTEITLRSLKLDWVKEVQERTVAPSRSDRGH